MPGAINHQETWLWRYIMPTMHPPALSRSSKLQPQCPPRRSLIYFWPTACWIAKGITLVIFYQTVRLYHTSPVMIKYVWHVAALMIVFCWLSSARSASYQQQHHQQQQQLNNLITDQKPQQQSRIHQATSASPASFWKDMSLVYRIYQQCTGENMSVCLKVKLLTGLEKAFRSAKSLKLIEGVQFVSSSEDNQQRSKLPSISEQDIEAVLPRGVDAKEQVLNSMILKRVGNFLQDHTLQIKFPDLRDSESNSVEGRKKKDKKGSGAYIMIPLLLGGTFVPIAYGALAMLAGKALIVSKLALVLASIIGIKKLLSGGGGGKESSHEVVVSSGGHSGWGRDFDMAYSGWKPAKESVGSAKSL